MCLTCGLPEDEAQALVERIKAMNEAEEEAFSGEESSMYSSSVGISIGYAGSWPS